tara:strand:+ start:767 stop:1438 length:672 start_codon:yes stop_codon:yes gene_type:complete
LLAIIQARMSSRRLKGKVLKFLGKKTLLERVIKNVNRSKYIKKIIIATSINKDDDEVFNFCKKRKIECFRGSLNNVYLRFVCVIKKYSASSFVRITADSPFIDPALIDRGIKLYKSGKYDMVTNTFPRSFPKGQSFSIHKSKIFVSNLKKIKKGNHKEHITPYFYENFKNFKIKNIKYNSNQSHLNMSIDTKTDLNKARKIIKRLNLNKKKNYLLNLVKVFTN